jgi:hypothetical protein
MEGMVTTHLLPFDSMGVWILRHGQAPSTPGSKLLYWASSLTVCVQGVTAGSPNSAGK